MQPDWHSGTLATYRPLALYSSFRHSDAATRGRKASPNADNASAAQRVGRPPCPRPCWQLRPPSASFASGQGCMSRPSTTCGPIGRAHRWHQVPLDAPPFAMACASNGERNRRVAVSGVVAYPGWGLHKAIRQSVNNKRGKTSIVTPTKRMI